MEPRYRELFNEHFSPALYDTYKEALALHVGGPTPFRVAETPVFFPLELRDHCAAAAREIVAQLSRPQTISRMRRAVPERWDTPGIDALPSFAQVDFAIVRGASGALEPRLIELQGFPSLTAFQIAQLDSWNEQFQMLEGLEGDWSCWFAPYDRESFVELARRTICGSEDPRHVILMDIDPPTQKTVPDFSVTKELFGVDAVCPTTLVKRGRELWRRDAAGEMVQVRRIYNRVVFDELEAKNIDLPFDYREELDVQWAPHPNWYWIWSKYSLPFIDHPAVPAARFLSDVVELPEDLQQNYVLKPLFSFAGGGVNVEPTAGDVSFIPESERANWCLQEKIAYEPALRAPDGGGVKVEIRMMFFRPDDEPELILAQNLCRLSRGKMLGVDFNKNFDWVGGTVGIWRP